MVNENKTTLNFYSISSNFNDVLLKLCNKIVKTEENLYVNFDKSDTKKDVDKFLWVSQKNNFLPHKTYGEKFSKKIRLFYLTVVIKSYKELRDLIHL